MPRRRRAESAGGVGAERSRAQGFGSDFRLPPAVLIADEGPLGWLGSRAGAGDPRDGVKEGKG